MGASARWWQELIVAAAFAMVAAALTVLASPATRPVPSSAPQPRSEPGTRGRIHEVLISDDGKGIQVFLYVPQARRRASKVARDCLLNALDKAEAATCYVYASEDALDASGIPERFGAGLAKRCWTAFAAGSVASGVDVTSRNPDYDADGCPEPDEV